MHLCLTVSAGPVVFLKRGLLHGCGIRWQTPGNAMGPPRTPPFTRLKRPGEGVQALRVNKEGNTFFLFAKRNPSGSLNRVWIDFQYSTWNSHYISMHSLQVLTEGITRWVPAPMTDWLDLHSKLWACVPIPKIQAWFKVCLELARFKLSFPTLTLAQSKLTDSLDSAPPELNT